MNRRKLITGLATLFAAPAIVRASSLMAISPVPRFEFLLPAGWEPYTINGNYKLFVRWAANGNLAQFKLESPPL